jgi:hypothetical protein
MTPMRAFLACFVVVASGLAASVFVAGCEEPPAGCRADADCGSGRCDVASGACVECSGSTDCADGEACCQGSCRAGSPEDFCGCGAAPSASGPTSCRDQVCVDGEGVRVAVANVASGTCACPCDPALGGTLCSVADTDPRGFSCGCDRSDPVGTCEAAAIDAAGIPHRPADTCSPQNACVCFAAGDVCEGSADCTSAGCVDVVNDATNCGVAGRTCSDDATGVAADGRCLGGGCVCNAASDCQGAGLNVDSCAFIGDVSQCVCDDYTSNGEKAACPMGLACVDGGCSFEGTAHGDRDALVAAIAAR